jgi:hypothetical protein
METLNAKAQRRKVFFGELQTVYYSMYAVFEQCFAEVYDQTKSQPAYPQIG